MSLESKLLQAIDQAFNSLDDLAGSFVIREITSSGYDPITGSPNNTSVQRTVTGIFDKYDEVQIDGTVIQAGDLKVLIKPVSTFKPSIGDILVDGAVEYTILNVESVRAYDTDFLWELQVRG